MSVKINSLSEKEIRDIGDAFADFQYAESEFGMGYLGKGRQAVSDYICAVAKGFFNSGKSYGAILSKLKVPYIYVGMVAVRKEYQGKGFMRKVLEIAFEEGRRQAVPVVLDTDAVLKKNKYEHLGMKCVVTQHFTDGVELYGMVYEPDNIPKEWKSEIVLEDMRILSSSNKNVWDRFAPVYSSFVTGTPGNKRAYESMYKRIKAVITDKEVLELATGPGVIARQVADEAKKMTATDYDVSARKLLLT
ncbi:Acetyltransferase (GNAT) domain-containing protein [Butyrivibrio sp. ob235]|uniref:GNAT family N-acetyltransferase n=1 Tax=Butyrivibrio sp. ob235 TaxID=1761780 RepID=UPI0008D04A59|nr:GNAT family N-acetyltransferase [Butyrivibrio sp. ob235]SEM28000.1 Acetyltransferase (GNAT) domain-containing protein [Butyrivibrio sp. ob235]